MICEIFSNKAVNHISNILEWSFTVPLHAIHLSTICRCHHVYADGDWRFYRQQSRCR